MDHQEALRDRAVEKYLLKEMPPPEREAFEAHFFDCQECAADVRATAAFLDAVKKQLPHWRGGRPARVPKRPWFDFVWRPAFAAPAFALLLFAVAYQNVVVLPRVAGETAQFKNPEILTPLSLIGGNSRGGPMPSATLAKGQALLISLDIPAAERFSSYACVLLAPSGAVVWRLPVSPSQAKDTVAIRVPSGVLEQGEYRLVVQGQANAGREPVDLASYRFTLNGSP